MRRFEDLQFNKQSTDFNFKKQAKLTLNNGITVLVIGGSDCYGDGITTFEIAAWKGTSFIQLGETDDTLYYLSKDEVIQKINELETLKID